MRPIDRVLSVLTDAKKSNNGWIARCPAHDDAKASLSVAIGRNDRVLLKCHAGCTVSSVVSALGLSLADLGGTPERTQRTPERRSEERSFASCAAATEHVSKALQR